MDRRNSLKSIVAGSVAGSLLLTQCTPGQQEEEKELDVSTRQGRTEEEFLRDQNLLEEQFFTEHEMASITQLSDIILPADNQSPSASAVGVPAFIEFIVKDMPRYQVPLRGGLMWLDSESNRRFEKKFRETSTTQQIAIVEDIAFPEDANEEFSQGERFFSLMRNLVLTGYFTSKEGINYLGYQGNIPNVWDGVPDEVLAKHQLSYEEARLQQYVDNPSMREKMPEWDDNGNLIG